MIKEYMLWCKDSAMLWGFCLLIGIGTGLVLLSSLGCIATLHGEGEVMFGMRNDNFFVIKHTTRALAPDSNSKAEVSVTPIIENIIDLKGAGVIGSPEEKEITEPEG